MKPRFQFRDPAKIAIHLFANGERIQEAELAAAPHVGEIIVMKDPFRTFEVEAVVTQDAGDGPVASVYLREMRYFFDS
jgi:hypothetical protein